MITATPTVNAMILYQNRKYYILKNCKQFIQFCISRSSKKQKLNVINYKHETHALAYTFIAGSDKFKCANAYIHAYNL